MTHIKNKQVVTFLSGSAGELDWILPVLDYLSKLQFEIKIVYLTKHVQQSVEHNRMLSDYINQPNSRVETTSCGGYFPELIEKYGYLMHRINTKLNKPKLLSIFFYIVEKVCERVFIINLPKHILQNGHDCSLIFSEFPSLRRPRDQWIKRVFNKSIFFYFPHSPHVYTEDLNRRYSNPKLEGSNRNNFLLLGHPGDYNKLNETGNFNVPELECICLGHPKYSDLWLSHYQKKANHFRLNANCNKVNILVMSRGVGNYLSKESHKLLVETIIKVVNDQFSDYKLFVKKHPRELDSHWDNMIDQYPSIIFVDEHILQMACKVNFAISFWTSGAMDCFMLGTPVIEFFDPADSVLSQVLDADIPTTIYRKLNIVLPAINEAELKLAVCRITKKDYEVSLNIAHPFFRDLINRSNKWHIELNKILINKSILHKNELLEFNE
jgi:hypothetical protein